MKDMQQFVQNREPKIYGVTIDVKSIPPEHDPIFCSSSSTIINNNDTYIIILRKITSNNYQLRENIPEVVPM